MDSVANRKINKDFPSPKLSSLAAYDCIGFDIDHTLVTYKSTETFPLVHDYIKLYCVNRLGVHPDLLLTSCDPADSQKGLFYDKLNGNLVKLDAERKVSAAIHGRHKVLTAEEIRQTYGPKRELIPSQDLEDLFVGGLGKFQHYKNPCVIFKDNYQAIFIQLAADLVDLVDRYGPLPSTAAAPASGTASGPTAAGSAAAAAPAPRYGKYDIWPVYDQAIRDYEENCMEVYENTGKYCRKISEDFKNFLRRCKSAGKVLFIVSSAYTQGAVDLLDYAWDGPGWEQVFDIAVTRARKPKFWTGEAPLMSLDLAAVRGGSSEAAAGLPVGPLFFPDQLGPGKIYAGGNWTVLKQILIQKLSNRTSNPKVLYVGDAVLDDVYISATRCQDLDTVAVVDELEFRSSSKIFGSFFDSSPTTGSQEPSLFYHLATTHAQLIIPSVEDLISLPLTDSLPDVDQDLDQSVTVSGDRRVSH